MDISSFLAEDFTRIGERIFRRCAQLNGKRLYLTGATGFFGKNILALLDYLHNRGVRFEVTALSRDPELHLSRYPTIAKRPWLQWERGDIQSAWPASGSYDLLLHTATDTAATAHLDKLSVFNGILAGTKSAMEFCESHHVGRILLTGSGAQYGSIPDEWAIGIPENSPIACNPTRPDSAYGEAKRASEMLATLYAERTGSKLISTRCFAFVGPGLPFNGHFAIGNFIRDALTDAPICMRTPGQAKRSYLYSADLACWLLILLLEADGSTCYNVGSDEGLNIYALAQLVRDTLNPELSITVGNQAEHTERMNYLPSIAMARGLGLDVWTPLNLAINRAAQWKNLST